MATDTLPVPTIPLRFDRSTCTYRALPDAQRIHAMLVNAAERQLATAAVAKQIQDAGFGEQLRDLIGQIAAQVANPIADEIEEACTEFTHVS